MKNSMNRKGFSLTELLMVVVVLGALAALTIPNFTQTIVKEKARQGVTYLRLIRTGEKIYKSNNGEYKSCADTTAIQTDLGVELTTDNFTFSVVADNLTDPANPTFVATADYTRDTGTTIITIDQAGTIAATGEMANYV